MALHNVALNLLDRLPTVVAKPGKRKSRSRSVLKLSGTGSLPEIKDGDLQRFRRQYGLWI
jgi:hypothetical protein